jgi:hypothetical protein
MMYASSKDAIRKQLVGISTEIQATGYDEITMDAGEWDGSDENEVVRYFELILAFAI